jgi:ribonuclease VapC
MIIDSSAILAILFDESDSSRYANAIVSAETCRVSAATFIESSIVIDAQNGKAGLHDLDEFLREADILIEPVTVEQARIAQRAWVLFGRGKHPARLNFGDCFSYALAKALDEPLLFKGSDFARTDIQPAI